MEEALIATAHRVCAWSGRRAPPGIDQLLILYGNHAQLTSCATDAGAGGVLIEHRDCLLQALAHTSTFRILIGDALEYQVSQVRQSLAANCAVIEVSLADGSWSAHSSLTGLPLLFIAEYPGGVLVGSDMCSLVVALGALPQANPLAVADIVRWGYPIHARTPFDGMFTLEPSSTARADAAGGFTIFRKRWPFEWNESPSPRPVEDTIAAFERAVGRVLRDSPVVSLSGGIDSRTLLIAAVEQGFRPRCVSMVRSKCSHDAVQAAAVCAALNLDHEVVHLNGAFAARLPDLVTGAAELTGGVDCVAQTADVFMYRTLGSHCRARVSGNFGNQIGRGGVESVPSVSRVSLLDPRIRLLGLYSSNTPWYLQDPAEGLGYVELRLKEAMWHSTANYGVGAHFATQLSPYADHEVISAAMPLLLHAYGQARTAFGLRLRDVRHRLIGPPMRTSFQRQYLCSRGATAADIPINLGWLAPGGWSASSVFRGVESVVAKIVDRHAPSGLRLVPSVDNWVSSRALYSLVRPGEMIRKELRALFLDMLHSSELDAIDGLDRTAVRAAVADHAAGRRDRSADLLPVFQISLGRSALRQLLKSRQAVASVVPQALNSRRRPRS